MQALSFKSKMTWLPRPVRKDQREVSEIAVVLGEKCPYRGMVPRLIWLRVEARRSRVGGGGRGVIRDRGRVSREEAVGHHPGGRWGSSEGGWGWADENSGPTKGLVS